MAVETRVPGGAHAESPRVRRTKRLLDETLLDALREKPITRVTVTELCSRAGVNRSTYYVYFDNPLDQLDRLEARVIEGLTREVDRRELRAGYSHERLEAIVEAALGYIGEQADVFRVLWGEHGSAGFERKLLTALAARALAPGERLTPEARSHLYQCIYSLSGMFGLVSYWLRDGADVEVRELAQTIVRANLAAVDALGGVDAAGTDAPDPADTPAP